MPLAEVGDEVVAERYWIFCQDMGGTPMPLFSASLRQLFLVVSGIEIGAVAGGLSGVAILRGDNFFLPQRR